MCRAAYVYVYEGSSEFFFRCNFPGVFDRIRGSSLSINGNNVAVLFYGSCYTNGDSETDRFFVWNRRNKVERYVSLSFSLHPSHVVSYSHFRFTLLEQGKYMLR